VEAAWYALHVYSGQEQKVKLHLEGEVVKAQLEEKVTSVLIPAEDVVEMKDGKKKVKNRVFFPGYMLVEMVLGKETSHLVLSVPGVINFVGPKNKPQRVPQHEIDRILRRVAEKEEPDIISVPFSVGDAIKVVDGPFNDFSGFVEEVNLEKNKVKVMVSIFGRPTPVELDFLQVELDTQ
jgi:transcription termination/antitermination protein NusG